MGTTVAVGVEEEFHVVDLATRLLTARADEVIGRLPGGQFGSELHSCVVEANSRPWGRLTDLAGDVTRLRRAATAAAQPLGLGIVAAGSVPLANPDTLSVTPVPRYQHMHGEYRMLVREHLICALQVHVDVSGRDQAVAVAHRVMRWLPALLALSASSPYWLGADTGYASYRTLIWRRWPTARAMARFESAADYDQIVADLVRSGVITDPGMIYYDVRPSAHLPTVELRICDACPLVDDVIMLAGLFRALVIQESAAAAACIPPSPVRPELVEAATWRAAQSGLEGSLVDPETASPVPASQLVRRMLADLRPTLQATGDWELLTELTESALARGTSAARQRVACARGGLPGVVDALRAETVAAGPDDGRLRSAPAQDGGSARPEVPLARAEAPPADIGEPRPNANAENQA